jgi:UDP-N-acetylmuramyl pentapeptide phosphotransferase/UDP-N-acetylglucosamine-1-phosphate transferase
VSALDLVNSYAPVFVVAFLVTLLTTPLVRRVAIAAGVVDHPDAKRKSHPYPIAYLGGVAVFLGLVLAIGVSYLISDALTGGYRPVPIAIIIGMVAITFTGLADDVWGWDPRLKIAGQLVAAAALTINEVGVNVAEGLFHPMLGVPDTVLFTVWDYHILSGHIYYWVGTALIAIFVLGGCNSANLIDGLDGLLSGVVGVVAIGLLAICLLIAPLDQAAHKQTAVESERVVESISGQIARYRDREGGYPPTVEALVDRGDMQEIPALPVGWTLEYDRFSGMLTANDRRRAHAVGLARSVHDEVRLYREREGAFPVTIAELVDFGYLEEEPEMPAGFGLRYNPNTGQVHPRAPESLLTGARVVLCMALLGAVLGFLPHNFKPASIFLGDCGSLLLGYMSVVIVLMLGDRGQTYFVFAGLIVFSVPIIDTTLAIIRRRLAGTPLSAADNQHLHHQLKRALGGVRRAVIALYGISALFAVVGVSLVVLVLHGLRVRFVYAIALVLFSSIAVVAVKAARHQKLLQTAQSLHAAARSERAASTTPVPDTNGGSTTPASSETTASSA